MDVETASAIVRLSERVDTLDTSLRQEIPRWEQLCGRCWASKGTLRFPLSEPAPASLIERIAKFPGQGRRAPGEGETGAAEKGQMSRVV